MWGLRLILILLGVAFIAGVYYYTRRHPPRSRKETPPQRTEPTVRIDAPRRPVTRAQAPARPATPPSGESRGHRAVAADSWPESEVPAAPEPSAPVRNETEAPAPPPREEKVFCLALRLPDEGVPAERLLHQLQRLGLALDERHIYHQPDAAGETVFSVANLFEPGVLDPLPAGSMLQGLSFFFMAEPSPATGSRFDRMLGTAYECARVLGGQLEDMNHRPLTAARELELKLTAVGARSD